MENRVMGLPLLLAAALVGSGLFAAPVDETMAKRAIGAWRARGGALGLKMGHEVRDVRRVEKDGAAYPHPIIDSAGKYGAGLSLECIGKALRVLGKKPDDITISVKLGWRRKPLVTPEPTFEPGAWAGLEWDAMQDISYDGILRCYEGDRGALVIRSE